MLADNYCRWRFDLAYDGSSFHGWAEQVGLPTIQGCIQDALRQVLRWPDLRIQVAGRTDAGVHARHQVAHLDLPAELMSLPGQPDQLDRPKQAAEPHQVGRPPNLTSDRLLRSLGAVLPATIRIHAISAAPPGFDARFSALWRQYAYRLVDDAAACDPLLRHHVLWLGRPFDIAAANQAALAALGEHDFIAFCKPRAGASTVRRLLRLDATRRPDGVVEIWARADAFCHSMVRSLAGALVAVGTGRRPVAWLAEVLAKGEATGQRAIGSNVLPAHGLTLEQISYPPDDQLAERAEASRVLRGTPH